jgi:ABC-type Fe3+ transport system permease subunit
VTGREGEAVFAGARASDQRSRAGSEPSKRGRRRRRQLRHYGVVALFLSPWLVGLVTFTLYPTFASLYFSFTHYDLLSAPHWVGFSNYRFMFSDPYFWQSLRNTLWMVVFATPVQVAFAIGCAVVLTRVRQGVGIYRTIFFVPTMVPAVAASLGTHRPRPIAAPHPPAAVVPATFVVQTWIADARTVGRGEHDDHLPGGFA